MRLALSGSLALLYLISPGGCIRQAPAIPPLPEKVVFGPARRRVCAKDGPSIIGGEVVNSGDKYPFLAWLGTDDGTGNAQFCGGTLISERIVLTAAHCVDDDEEANKKMYVRFKLADFSTEKGIERKVVNWQRHKDYNRQTMFYDLALLLLDEKIPASMIKPVSLSDGSQPFEKGGEKIVTGWGSTNEECSKYDSFLRDASVPMGAFVPDCGAGGSKSIGVKEDFDFTRQICAGMFQESQMNYPGCGDSGGPLMTNNQGAWTQVGVVSWTYGLPYPDVFTRVSAYRGWIRDLAERIEREGPKY
mmetsp:Transcript_110071/g.311167  ORF Transcript_110071/g.311167 Transcript_110071/m.311167 type:complete len:303 (-) Transcript_110071:44-952(-)